MKQFMRTMSVVGLCALLFAACDSDYNLDKISLEVTVGDTEGITVPLGTTGKITIESLLGNEIELNPDADGFYSFGMEDAITETLSIGTLAPITGLAPTIAPSSIELMGEMSVSVPQINELQTVSYPSGLGSGFTIPAASPLVGITQTMTHGPAVFEEEYEIALPDHVKSIDKVCFGTDGAGSEVAITFDIAGLAPITQNRVLNKFIIEAPAGFELKKIAGDALDAYATISKGTGSTTNNHFEVNAYPMSGSTICLRFLVMSAEFDGTPTEGKFLVNDDITYSYEMAYTIKAGTTGSTAPSVNAQAAISVYNATVTLDEWEQSFSFSEQFDQNVSLPKEVKAIDYLEICRSGSSAQPMLDVKLGLEGSPLDEIALSSLELTLPEILDVEAPSGWTLAGNVLKATNITLQNNATSNIITLPLKGLKNIPIVSGAATIDGELGVKATIAVESGEQLTINANAQNIVIAPTVKIDDISIKSVVGQVEPDLDDLLAPIEVDLSELSNALGENIEIDLNLASPTIDLAVENPIGVGIDLVVKIDAWKGGAVAKSIATPTLTILGAEGTTPTITNISLTGDTPAEGQTKVEGLMELINMLPEKLVVTLDAATNKSKPHTLIVQDSYTFKVNYSVGAALKFDSTKEGKLNYTTVIEDVDLSELATIDIVLDSLTVNVKAQSTLPLDALLKVKFLDGEKNAIADIKTLTTGKIAGSNDGTPKDSQISIGVGMPGEESSVHFGELFGRVKAVECTFEGTTLAGAGLKPDQWLQATLSLCINNGLTIDLGSLAEGDDTEEGGTE